MVLSRDLKWENKTYKLKSSFESSDGFVFFCLAEEPLSTRQSSVPAVNGSNADTWPILQATTTKPCGRDWGVYKGLSYIINISTCRDCSFIPRGRGRVVLPYMYRWTGYGFYLSVLNRVYIISGVCPKQWIFFPVRLWKGYCLHGWFDLLVEFCVQKQWL